MEQKCKELSNKNYKWMADNYEKIKKKPLNRIKIPGTHDSFTNSINFRNNDSALMFANDSPSEMWKVFSVPFIPKTFMLMMLVPWANTQSCTATEQLNHGIRYFDVRICKDDRESLDNQFKICHNFYAGKIMDILSEVRDFVINVAPSEFIILDFNHFYGLSQKDHDYLLSKIITQVGDVMIKPSQFKLNSTLESMWANTTRRVFIFYNDNYLKATSPDIAEYFHTNDDIEYTWGDTLNINYLNEYNLRKLKQRSESKDDISNTLLSLQLVLTPNIGTIVQGFFNRPYSILDITQPMISPIQQWIPSYDQSLLNIITCDYYHLYNFTDIVIQSNT
ncbi:predicted protein [Naegleria gruberi]|uniref:Predicted protein n=1 Tax=Naegleria gruberi TaxID=5762 RepID=D2VXR7_NAEGR|nr:uncharacterized protein NAEGRDRAFT_53085 [Naegleria gruberi]EFC38383.1 predicted protein [Naegleria gruberi]|eukprot:XP_002671127.1 predicted protein [Naegleria gruberi strain NEG-M]